MFTKRGVQDGKDTTEVHAGVSVSDGRTGSCGRNFSEVSNEFGCKNPDQVRMAVLEWIEGRYNRIVTTRPREYLAPINYEKRLLTTKNRNRLENYPSTIPGQAQYG